jgi:GT2 family glycosyltransferase
MCQPYGDNTIQHNGVFGQVNQNKIFGVSHIGLKSYYNYSLNINNVFGNTGGLLMIRKNIFEICGFFNENYISCFEDVELNMVCTMLGLTNYNDGSLVAYHYESVSRNLDPKNLEKLQVDYRNNLLPFVSKNIDKLKKTINIV